MGQKDLYQSDFYEDKGRFADVFNGVLFDGRMVMKPEEVETVDSVITHLSETETGKKVIADKICKWCGRYVSVVVLENQSYVDYRMVLRIMEAEVMNYEKQRREQYQQNKKQGYEYRNDEYLSKMRKDQKLIPVITLVLYLGKDKLWDGARSLYEMLEMDEQVKPFVNDFKLNLFDYHDSTDFSRFQTENRLLFEMLSCQKDKEKMKEVLRRHFADSMVDKESAKAILGIINEKVNLETIMKKDEHDREVYDMCQAFEDYKEEGRTEGRIEGRIEGREEACEKIISIMKELNVAAEIIREKLMEKYFFSVSEVDEKMKKYY